jgi:hypothetical protein
MIPSFLLAATEQQAQTKCHEKELDYRGAKKYNNKFWLNPKNATRCRKKR